METTSPPASPIKVPEAPDCAAVLTAEEVKVKIAQEVNGLITWVMSCHTLTFFEFESQLVPKVLAVGGLLVQLFLCLRHEQFEAQHPQAPKGYKRQGPCGREVGTFFGKVR